MKQITNKKIGLSSGILPQSTNNKFNFPPGKPPGSEKISMKKEIKGYYLAFLSSILSGGAFLFPALLGNLHVSPLTQTFVRNFFAGFILLIFLLFTNKKVIKINFKIIPIFVVLGTCVFLENLLSYSAITLGTPIALVAFVFNLQPILTALLSNVILREHVNAKSVFYLIISIAGSFLLTNIFSIKSAYNVPLIGIILAFFATLCFSGEIISAKISGISKLNSFATFIYSYLFSSLISLIAGYINPYPKITALNFNFPLSAYFIILLSAIYGIIFINLFYAALKYIQASKAGLILLFAPISSALLGFFILKEMPTLNIIFGGLIISLAALLSIISTTKKYEENE